MMLKYEKLKIAHLIQSLEQSKSNLRNKSEYNALNEIKTKILQK